MSPPYSEENVPDNAPEHCPVSTLAITIPIESTQLIRCHGRQGTGSDQAGKASACEGCPNQNICATAPKGPDPGKEYNDATITLFNRLIVDLI